MALELNCTIPTNRLSHKARTVVVCFIAAWLAVSWLPGSDLDGGGRAVSQPAVRSLVPKAISGQVVVRPGDSARLLSFASKDESVSVNQMMVALLRLNPRAFAGGNLNRLQVGEILDIPTQSMARLTPRAEADKLIARHNTEYRLVRSNSETLNPSQGNRVHRQEDISPVDSNAEQRTGMRVPAIKASGNVDPGSAVGVLPTALIDPRSSDRGDALEPPKVSTASSHLAPWSSLLKPIGLVVVLAAGLLSLIVIIGEFQGWFKSREQRLSAVEEGGEPGHRTEDSNPAADRKREATTASTVVERWHSGGGFAGSFTLRGSVVASTDVDGALKRCMPDAENGVQNGASESYAGGKETFSSQFHPPLPQTVAIHPEPRDASGAKEEFPLGRRGITGASFRFDPDVFLRDQRVQSMSLEEEAAYIRLLVSCWLDASIPADPNIAAKLIGKGASTTVAAAAIAMFVPSKVPGRMLHPALEEERAKILHWKRKSSEGGRKSAAIRRKVPPTKPPVVSRDL